MDVNQLNHLLLKMKRMENVGPIQKKKGGLKQKKFVIGQVRYLCIRQGLISVSFLLFFSL